MALVWEQTLGRGRVGLDDDYFLLGGDSVLATVITGRLREALETDDVRIHDILSCLTVGRLAATLAERGQEPEQLETVAEIFLEVEAMTDEELEAQLLDTDEALEAQLLDTDEALEAQLLDTDEALEAQLLDTDEQTGARRD